MNKLILENLFRLQLTMLDALVQVLPGEVKRVVKSIGLDVIEAVHDATEDFLKANQQTAADGDKPKDTNLKKVVID